MCADVTGHKMAPVALATERPIRREAKREPGTRWLGRVNEAGHNDVYNVLAVYILAATCLALLYIS